MKPRFLFWILICVWRFTSEIRVCAKTFRLTLKARIVLSIALDFPLLISFIYPVPGISRMLWLGLSMGIFTHVKGKILQYVWNRQVWSMEHGWMTKIDCFYEHIPCVGNGSKSRHPQRSFKLILRQIGMWEDGVQNKSDLGFIQFRFKSRNLRSSGSRQPMLFFYLAINYPQ